MKTITLLASVLTMSLLQTSGAAAPRPLIVAHRGSSFTAPENTLAALKLGFDQKSEACELDIHVSKDGRLMVIHDKDTSRTAGGKNLVVVQSPAEELRKLDFGSFLSEKYAGEKIPFLEEALDIMPKGQDTYVEIKVGPEAVPPLKKALEDSGKMDQIVIISFKMESCVASKKAMPSIPVYYLKGAVKDKVTSKPLPHSLDLVKKVKDAGLDGLDVSYDGVTPELVKETRAQGLSFHVWTVDQPEDALRMAKLGVDSITTNKPDLLLETFKAAGFEDPTTGTKTAAGK
jgi:glycerophosphoryl diester phosphodiesterase